MAESLPLAAQRHRVRKYKRKPPPPIAVAYRMGYVATISANDAHGKSLTTKRISATAEEGPLEMMERLGAELERLRQQRPQLPIVIVQDGAPELWNLVEEWFANFNIPIDLKLIDRYHLFERLAQVAELLERDPYARAKMLARWRASLDHSDSAIRSICKQIDARTRGPLSAESRARIAAGLFGIDWPIERPLKVSGAKADIIDGHLRYCRNHADKMRYASAREHGFPIGSGPTEGACKSIFAARLKRSGQRWFASGASACLQLRTLYLNNRLEQSLSLYVANRRRAFASSLNFCN